jgi:hypothetical protein
MCLFERLNILIAYDKRVKQPEELITKYYFSEGPTILFGD